MSLILITPPEAEPLSLADAKHFLRVEHDYDDELIAALIAGARGHVEAATRRALMSQTWRLTLDAWPRHGRITVLLAPLREVVAAQVYDAAGLPRTIDPETFVVDAAASPGVIAFPPWVVAAPERSLAGIEIDVAAGYGEAAEDVPQPLLHAIRLLVAHWYENRGVTTEAGAQPMPAGVAPLIAPFRGIAL